MRVDFVFAHFVVRITCAQKALYIPTQFLIVFGDFKEVGGMKKRVKQQEDSTRKGVN